MSNLLALDLGTLTGWCLDPTTKTYGRWDLKPKRFDGGGMRYVRFRNNLDEIHRSSPVSQIVYEEVRRHKGTDAAHIYGGLMATLTAWCEDCAVPYTAVPVGQIKKNWTGNGGAGKPEMIAAGARKGFADVTDDNVMDAIALWHCWQQEGIK